jgi:large subunit ribosomal protein L28
MRICQITGARPKWGSRIHRRGLAKKKGGIGMHVTAITRRLFVPNLRRKRIFVPELGEWVKVRCTARALKTIAKNGAYATLLKAGLIQPVPPGKRSQPKTQPQTN